MTIVIINRSCSSMISKMRQPTAYAMGATISLIPCRGIHRLIQWNKEFRPIVSRRIHHQQWQQWKSQQLRQYAADSSKPSGSLSSSADSSSSVPVSSTTVTTSTTPESSGITNTLSRSGILESFLDLSSSALSSSSTREQRRMRRDRLRQRIVKKRKAAKEAAAAASSKKDDGTTTDDNTMNSSEQEETKKVRPPFWYYLSIFPDPHGYDPNYKSENAIEWPKDWATFKLICNESYALYKSTWEGVFIKDEDNESNAKKDKNEDANSSSPVSKAIEYKRKEIKSNISKNTKFLKEESTKVLHTVQENTGIYTLKHLKAWASRQMILATECLTAFTQGYRRGRDDEVEKMATLYFKDFFAEDGAKKKADNDDDNDATKKKRIRIGRTKTIITDDGTKMIKRRQPKRRVRNID